ncbi:MAG: hypothetical protein JNM72_18070 [Deltaproteobacteria bacterium]|nr:hypothetical protein [Deltaproteobacteria bacterium]
MPTIARADGPADPPPRAVVIDQIVLVIGDRVVTASELRLEEALRARLPWWAPPQPEGTSTLQVVADAALIRALAGDAALYVPDDELVRDRAAQVRAAWGDPEAWQSFLLQHGLDEERLLTLVRSRLIVDRYLQRTLSLAARSEGKPLEALYAGWILTQRGRLPLRVPSAVEGAP